MDLHMPVLDGITLIELRRSDDRTTTGRIIAFTAYTNREDEAMRAGADLFLPKPRRPSDVLDAVNAQIAQGARPLL
jgi:CheY-like chemotaxis protein